MLRWLIKDKAHVTASLWQEAASLLTKGAETLEDKPQQIHMFPHL